MNQNYTVGSPFRFERNINPADEYFSISGTVVYNNGEIAVVRIPFSSELADEMVYSLEETRSHFPDFEPETIPGLFQFLWIDISTGGFIINEEDYEEQCDDRPHLKAHDMINAPSSLKCHPTSHPTIVFAGGDLFGSESLSKFDGILAFAERGGFGAYTRAILKDGYPQCPHRVHFLSVPLEQLAGVVQEDLDFLVGQDSRTIGIHLPSFISESKTALQAIVEWLDTHAGSVDSLVFVDAHDDYFNCFGLDSFGEDRAVSNPSPTEFESYFEHRFQTDMKKAFGTKVRSGGISAYVITKENVLEKTRQTSLPIEFSVGLFYTNLVPQAVAKVTGRLQDTFDFLKVSKMPQIDRFMGGFMDSYTILADTGLLPENKDDVTAWLRLAKEEGDYFFRVLIHHVIGGIREPESAPAQHLAHLNGRQIKAMRQEMKKYLKSFEACLKGGPAPANYFLPEEIRSI